MLLLKAPDRDFLQYPRGRSTLVANEYNTRKGGINECPMALDYLITRSHNHMPKNAG
jgi:hypothetical protein